MSRESLEPAKANPPKKRSYKQVMQEATIGLLLHEAETPDKPQHPEALPSRVVQEEQVKGNSRLTRRTPN